MRSLEAAGHSLSLDVNTHDCGTKELPGPKPPLQHAIDTHKTPVAANDPRSETRRTTYPWRKSWRQKGFTHAASCLYSAIECTLCALNSKPSPYDDRTAYSALELEIVCFEALQPMDAACVMILTKVMMLIDRQNMETMVTAILV
jgi:hypothetical protein